MAFDPDAYLAKKQSQPSDQFDPDTYLQKRGAPAVANNAEGRPQITGGRGIAGQRHQQAEFDESQRVEQLRQQSLAEGRPFARDLPEIGEAPEMNQLSWPALLASAGATFTFDDAEVGDIVSKQLGGNVGQDIEGNYFITMPSGESYTINAPGFSGQDAIKFVGTGAAYTPAARAATLPGMAVGGMATQGLIEAGQTGVGGKFNPGDVVMAAAAPVVANKVGQALKSGIRQLKGRSSAAAQYLDEQITGANQQADDLSLLPIEDRKTPVKLWGNNEPPQAQRDLSLSPVQQQSRNTEFWQRVNTPVKEGAKKAEIRQAIREGTKEAAGWTVNRRGQVVADPVGREVVKNGFDPRTVSTIKFGSNEDKRAMGQMLDMAEETLKSGTARVRNRPQKVIGDTVMKRFNIIRDENKKAGTEVGQFARSELAGKRVDISSAMDNFESSLSDMGVSFGGGGAPNFAQSQLNGNSATSVINRVYSMLGDTKGAGPLLTGRGQVMRDGLKLHKLKQYIDRQIDWEKPAQQSLDKQAVNTLKQLRRDINQELQKQSENYANANARFAETVDSLQSFYDVMGRRFDPENSRVSDLVGQELRKVLSNYGVRNDMITAIDQLDGVAMRYGANFKDDPLHQVVFYSDLERLLGSFADNSLQGVAEKAVGLGLDAATGAPVNTAANVIRSGLKKVMSPSEEKAIKSMRKLLKP